MICNSFKDSLSISLIRAIHESVALDVKVQMFLTALVPDIQAAPPPKPVVKQPAFASSGRFSITEGNAWDIEGASWAVNGGIFGRIGDGIVSKILFCIF